jgi:hypothetical protein
MESLDVVLFLLYRVQKKFLKRKHYKISQMQQDCKDLNQTMNQIELWISVLSNNSACETSNSPSQVDSQVDWHGVSLSSHNNDSTYDNSRTFIGCITSGCPAISMPETLPLALGIKHLLAAHSGIGICEIQRLYKLMQQQYLYGRHCPFLQHLVLFRNPQSQWLRPAFLRLIS